MSSASFRLAIGAKRQVTIPRDCMRMLSLEEGGELLLEVSDHHATLTPLISVPRTELPEELRKKFEGRRGRKDTDLPLAEFLEVLLPPGGSPLTSAAVERPKRPAHRSR